MSRVIILKNFKVIIINCSFNQALVEYLPYVQRSVRQSGKENQKEHTV